MPGGKAGMIKGREAGVWGHIQEVSSVPISMTHGPEAQPHTECSAWRSLKHVHIRYSSPSSQCLGHYCPT